jgi:hypothetical protein
MTHENCFLKTNHLVRDTPVSNQYFDVKICRIRIFWTWNCCTHLKFDIFPDFYSQNRGRSKLTRGSSQVNLTLIETETRVQAYFDTPFLNFKIFLKDHIKFLHKPIFWHLNIYINIARMGKTKDLSKDCKNIVLNLFKFFQLEEGQGKTILFPR